MYDKFESDENIRREIIDCLYHSLMYDWDIPGHIRDHYGLTDDYRLYHCLNAMDPTEYRQKAQRGEVADVLEVDARLTHRAEAIFERLCPRPPKDYLDKLNDELEKLGQIAAMPDNIHDLIHIRPDFLAKYCIDRNAPYPKCSRLAELAYRKLDARFVKMTGRRPYADELFGTARQMTDDAMKENRPGQPHKVIVRNPPSKRKKLSI